MILLYSCVVKNTVIVLYSKHSKILWLYCTVNIQKYYDCIVQCTGVSVWGYLVNDCTLQRERATHTKMHTFLNPKNNNLCVKNGAKIQICCFDKNHPGVPESLLLSVVTPCCRARFRFYTPDDHLTFNF